VTGGADAADGLALTARLGHSLAGPAYDVFGNVVAGGAPFAPEAPPRKRRTLRAPSPEAELVRTEDGALVRLTRYARPGAEPVVLAHGLGTSSRVFTADTVDANLLEYLHVHRYDVWLLDWRASVLIEPSRAASTLDAVAHYDWPAALARVAEEANGPVHVVADGVGSMALFAALLLGLERVASVVALQLALHLDVKDRPAVAQCDSPACVKAAALYGPMYEHERLSRATHQTVHELVAPTSHSLVQHVARIAAAGHLVSADGRDSYLQHLERLAGLSVTVLHGEANGIHSQKAAKASYDLLRTCGRGLYVHHEIPGYGYLDCLIGKTAVADVYPLVLDHLERVHGGA
jgi:cholesterol oxidase